MSAEHPVTRVAREHGPMGRVALAELRKIRPAAPEEELARVDAIADLAVWTRVKRGRGAPRAPPPRGVRSAREGQRRPARGRQAKAPCGARRA
jgi:hypothetical protein